MIAPFPPEFVPGDKVKVVEVEWPYAAVRLTGRIGLFQDVGLPRSTKGMSPSRTAATLNQHLAGVLRNGERGLVMAAMFCGTDKKWYYLLLGAAHGKCFGWTRSAVRLRKELL